MSDLRKPQQEHRAARGAALVLAWIKSGLVLLAAVSMATLGGGQDPAGRAYLYGGFLMGGLYWLAFILPALLLLRRSTGRRVSLAFVLLILPGLILAIAAAAL
jgi:hypothetical protein